jgi:hypothetical protein
MYFMLSTGFLRQTVPVLLSSAGVFLPMVFPWLFKEAKGRAVALGLLLTLACQLVLGSMSYLHFTYFFAYLPALCPVIGATALECFRRSHIGKTLSFGGVILVTLGLYSLAPAGYNIFALASGRQPLGGDLTGISSTQQARMVEFIENHTPKNAVIAASTYDCCYLQWPTRRTFICFLSTPEFQIADSDMWQKIDRRIPIDYILLTSASKEDPSRPLLPGFVLVQSINEPDLQARLFRRSAGAEAGVSDKGSNHEIR